MMYNSPDYLAIWVSTASQNTMELQTAKCNTNAKAEECGFDGCSSYTTHTVNYDTCYSFMPNYSLQVHKYITPEFICVVVLVPLAFIFIVYWRYTCIRTGLICGFFAPSLPKEEDHEGDHEPENPNSLTYGGRSSKGMDKGTNDNSLTSSSSSATAKFTTTNPLAGPGRTSSNSRVPPV